MADTDRVGEEETGMGSATGNRLGSVLVVHGDADHRDRLDGALTDRGHTVFTAESGPEALEMMTACPPDLVLLGMDSVCPGALASLERIKSHELLHAIPVLMVYTPGDVFDTARYIRAGAEDILFLSGEPDLLYRKVDGALELERLRALEDRYLERIEKERRQADELIHVVVPAGVALSAEKDFTRLLERILLEAKRFCNADGGTLYLQNESDQLEFMMFHNDSMDIRVGGTTGQPVRLPPLDLHDPVTGEPNHSNVATFAALTGQILNIPDARDAADFDFSGAKRFDETHGYRSISFLTLPLRNPHGRTLGVLQLINAQDRETGKVIPFPVGSQYLMSSFSLLATVAIDSYSRTHGLRQELQHLRAELDRARRRR